MKNLLERLKPEYRDLLDAEEVKYPTAIKSLKNSLSELYRIEDLRYNDMHALQVYGVNGLNYVDPWSLFTD